MTVNESLEEANTSHLATIGLKKKSKKVCSVKRIMQKEEGRLNLQVKDKDL